MSKEAIAHYEAALKEAFPRGATGEVFHHWNEARYLIATEALDKMAENAKELGLDYDAKSDHRLMEQPAQQEPVFTYDQVKAHIQAAMMSAAQRTWVGLSDAQNTVIWANSQSVDEAIRATEKQLMENNI